MDLRYEYFALAPMLSDVELTVAPLAGQNGNRFEIHYDGEPAALFADPVRVRQILVNLLGNACKFTERGTISLRVQMQEAGRPPSLLLAPASCSR